MARGSSATPVVGILYDEWGDTYEGFARCSDKGNARSVQLIISSHLVSGVLPGPGEYRRVGAGAVDPTLGTLIPEQLIRQEI